MRAVGLKILKNRLSEYVRLVTAGETILVTDRDRVVAELVPPRPGHQALASDALLTNAIRKGWLTPALGASTPRPPRRPVMLLGDLLADLERDRADR
jgi:antitoxin (DNA-binding transcriptional repressor) of toxin-antitoxin stability system